jgi:hypothetical protein
VFFIFYEEHFFPSNLLYQILNNKKFCAECFHLKEVDAFNKQNVLQLNIPQLAAGSYFIKIISADGRRHPLQNLKAIIFHSQSKPLKIFDHYKTFIFIAFAKGIMQQFYKTKFQNLFCRIS